MEDSSIVICGAGEARVWLDEDIDGEGKPFSTWFFRCWWHGNVKTTGERATKDDAMLAAEHYLESYPKRVVRDKQGRARGLKEPVYPEKSLGSVVESQPVDIGSEVIELGSMEPVIVKTDEGVAIGLEVVGGTATDLKPGETGVAWCEKMVILQPSEKKS